MHGNIFVHEINKLTNTFLVDTNTSISGIDSNDNQTKWEMLKIKMREFSVRYSKQKSIERYKIL